MGKTKKQSQVIDEITSGEPRNWGDDDHRVEAVREFVKKLALEENKDERQKCCSSPQYAKKKFAQWGRFYIEGSPAPDLPPFNPGGEIEAIPATTKFRVHKHGKSDRLRRDKRVVIVLKRKEEEGEEPEKLDDVALWRCSYTPYATK